MYDVYLCDHNGRRIANLSTTGQQIDAALVTNSYDVWTTVVSNEFVPLMQPRRIVQIWRKGRYITGGFILKWVISGDTLIISGADFNILLDKCIIAYAAGSAEADKSGTADDVIKEIITENRGTGAPTARQMDISIQADASAAQTVTRAFSRRDVLRVCQELAEESTNKGTRLYFGIRPYWGGGLELSFETAINQWNVNRSFTGENTTIFGESLGNMQNYQEVYDYWNEVNDVYVGGQGLADQRLVVQVTDSDAATADQWALSERFLNMSNELTSAALTSAGNMELYEARPKKTFSGNLMDTNTTAFGEHWFFGDRVAVMQGGRSLEGVIEKVRVKYRGQKETITAQVEGNL